MRIATTTVLDDAGCGSVPWLRGTGRLFFVLLLGAFEGACARHRGNLASLAEHQSVVFVLHDSGPNGSLMKYAFSWSPRSRCFDRGHLDTRVIKVERSPANPPSSPPSTVPL